MSTVSLVPIATELEGIGHVLRDRRLDVPPYQRAYSWDNEAVADFWWDLRAAFGSSSGQYFLGTMVLTTDRGTSRTTIIDGQQRLATATLLLTAMRNEFLRRGDEHRAEVIERDYILTMDLRTADLVPRLQLNPEDKHALHAALFHRPGIEGSVPPPDSTSRIGRALAFLDERVAEQAQQAGAHWADLLFRWIEFLEQRARVIVVDVTDEADAFLIFETVNDRGRELTVADLLKNYLFGLARDSLDEVQAHWLGSLDALEASADEEVFATFVRHFWSSQEGATRERDLYGRIKAAINSGPRALRFARQLEEAAPAYAALLSADAPQWAERPRTRLAAETLLRLGLEQNRPLLLAAMLRFAPDEFERLLSAVISWSVRGLIVGGIGGGTTERAYAEAAVAVTDGAAKSVDDVYEQLASIIPGDEGFASDFATKRINRTRLSKYLLVALSQYERDVADPMIVGDQREASFQVASVLKRNASAEDWPNFLDDDMDQQALRLGNQYVVDEGDEISPATDYLERYSRPELWGPDRIAERQATLAGLAVNVWPRRP